MEFHFFEYVSYSIQHSIIVNIYVSNTPIGEKYCYFMTNKTFSRIHFYSLFYLFELYCLSFKSFFENNYAYFLVKNSYTVILKVCLKTFTTKNWKQKIWYKNTFNFLLIKYFFNYIVIMYIALLSFCNLFILQQFSIFYKPLNVFNLPIYLNFF